jgi:tetratricopeptide (TPR) repeat protein
MGSPEGIYPQKEKIYRLSSLPELYDLNHDFDELKNLAQRKKVAQLTSQLKEIIRALTPSEKIDATQQVDRKTRERLASLGYISSVRVSQKKDFSARDDVKILLPYLNRIGEGWKLYKNGNQDKAIKLLKEITEERKDVDLAYKYLASIYQEIGNTDEAIVILEQGLKALPSNYEIFVEYIKALIFAQQYDKVISAFEKTNTREAEYDPEIWSDLGTAYAKKGNFDEAIKAFEMGLSLDDKIPTLYHNLANACYSHGLQSKDSLIFSRCFDYYKKAIELDPEFPAPYYGLGHAYIQQGNLGGAIYCWEKALEADPDLRQAHFDLAMAYLKAGDKTKAFDLLSEYKKRYYHLLTPAEKERLDSLIEQCQK